MGTISIPGENPCQDQQSYVIHTLLTVHQCTALLWQWPQVGWGYAKGEELWNEKE